MPHPLSRSRPAALFALLLAPAIPAAATEFEVTFTPEVRPGPVSARVYVMLGPASKMQEAGKYEPRTGPNWFQPQPFFAVDAKDWAPGTPLMVGADALGYPGPLKDVPPGRYVAQAVLRLNPDTHRLGDGEGNAYGPLEPLSFTVNPESDGDPVRLTINRVVPPRPFRETERVRLVEFESKLLSAFHGRPIKHRAGVILPESDPDRRRGTLYIIPGFGGDHFMAHQVASNPRYGFGNDLVRVVLDPDCGTGHHVFADSAFNGPRGRALVEELIPYIEAHFPVIPGPRARLLNGHSSGGWSSLWLQVTYPDTFGGVWSTSPDPVDFRDFQQIDLYAPDANMFRDPDGHRRSIARMRGRAVLFYDDFSKLEDVIGDGGQLHSFEAVFSPLGPDRRPRPLYDRSTGRVDPETAHAWRAYDIRRVLERDWPRLGPKLKGKLHVVMGDADTFYLEGATRLLKDALKTLGSDAAIEIVPGRDHFTVLDAALAGRFNREMNAAVAAGGP